MKKTTVPAQVVSISPKIVGDLSLTQLIIICLPLFFAALIYTIVSPEMDFTVGKLIVILPAVLLIPPLAIERSERLLVELLAIRAAYLLRPRYYIFDKRSRYMRGDHYENSQYEKRKESSEVIPAMQAFDVPQLPLDRSVRLKEYIESPATELALETDKKGRLYVSIKEIAPQENQ